MEIIVSSQIPIYTKALPDILYWKKATAATVKSMVEMTAITPLAMVSQANSLAGEQGLQYIRLNTPRDRYSTMEIGMLINALQQIPTVERATYELCRNVRPESAASLFPEITMIRINATSGIARLNRITSGDLKKSFCSTRYILKNLIIKVPPLP